jgi:hypothetical protein
VALAELIDETRVQLCGLINRSAGHA